VDKQLNNIRHYNKLDQDLTFKHAEEIASSIRTMVDNPGRPIVSSCGAPTECISEFVDYHLQPLVMQIPSYLKDTKDFLWKIPTNQTTSYSH